MPLYEITGPGGKVYEIEGPPGASKEQIVQAETVGLSLTTLVLFQGLILPVPALVAKWFVAFVVVVWLQTSWLPVVLIN